ncbi:hypothetical protein V6N13_048053 [Hibiscus sabdariffa]
MHQRTWPLAERWWADLRGTANSAGHGGRKIVGGNMRKMRTPWAGNLEEKLTLRPWPHAALLESVLTVFGHCGPDRDHGCSVNLPGTSKCRSDRGSGYAKLFDEATMGLWQIIWCSFKTNFVTEPLEPPGGNGKLFDEDGLSCGNNQGTSLEPEPMEPTLIHNISQDGDGLRCGFYVCLTRLGSYRTDKDYGCHANYPDQANVGLTETEGAV